MKGGGGYHIDHTSESHATKARPYEINDVRPDLRALQTRFDGVEWE